MTRPPDPEPGVLSPPRWWRWLRSPAGWVRRVRPRSWVTRLGGRLTRLRSRRQLFLDDDPARAERFLADSPRAVWVTNVPDCLARLAERWDEVHLDHDLGGRTYVDSSETDCGMEVIRWLCRQPRPHLKRTRFYVHTHNATAGLLMVLLMRKGGYKAEFRPFGLDLEKLLAHNEPPAAAGPDRAPANRAGASRPGWWSSLAGWGAVGLGVIVLRSSGAILRRATTDAPDAPRTMELVEFDQLPETTEPENVAPAQSALPESSPTIQPPPRTRSS